MPITNGIIKFLNSSKLPKIFIETGFKEGETTDNIKRLFNFEKQYSIEINENYVNKHKHRYEGTNVELICGDSGTELTKLLNKINEPCVFFLDAHHHNFTKDPNMFSPLIKELEAINNHHLKNEHIILIDDCFYITKEGQERGKKMGLADDIWYQLVNEEQVLEKINEIYNNNFNKYKFQYPNGPYGCGGKNFIYGFTK